jgi:nicotinamide-nucleotide amidase
MHNEVNASIITIGDELLIGQTIDTNSAWMAKELNDIGIWVHRRVAVGDVWEDIWNALDEESKKSKLVLITGGLGPTADDITKPLLCSYFGGKLIIDEISLANVRNIFDNILKRPIIERNLKQAELPDVCTPIQNSKGTAPGMWFEKEGCIFVSMPGVPHEMKSMMAEKVMPSLKSKFALNHIYHKTLLTAGIGESYLAERINAFETALPNHIKLAYLPNYGMVRLRLTAKNAGEQTEKEIEELFQQLKKQLDDVLVIDEDLSLQEVLTNLLKQKNKTIGTAESCTGGYIAHLITAIPGSSAIFKGSIISYSNEIKSSLLNVENSTLENFGAVSKDTATEMIDGALSQLKTDYVIVTTGIMGPSGGSIKKPVGSVWIGVGSKKNIETKFFQFRFDRQRNIELTAINALNEMRKFILQEL